MARQPALSMLTQIYQPPTPESPLLPTLLPHVCETIPQLPLPAPDTTELVDQAADTQAVQTALHVLSAERDALAYLLQFYESNPLAQDGFIKAVDAIQKSICRHGRLVVCGVGKSGKIGEKMVATMNSLGIRSTFLHPTEGLHGDLGMIGPSDTILLITFSGHTRELRDLLPHVSQSLPLIVITSHTQPSTCPLFFSRSPRLSILLPAPVPVSEELCFGVPAPTTSTTIALALSDALALALSQRLHSNPRAVFHNFHPGGAIGAKAAVHGPPTMATLTTMVDSVPLAEARPGASYLTSLDILLTAAKSTSGWVRLSPSTVVAPRRVQHIGTIADLGCPLCPSENDALAVEKSKWISILAGNTIKDTKDWILRMRAMERGKDFLKIGTVLGIVDSEGNVSGVAEIEDVVGEEEVQTWERIG